MELAMHICYVVGICAATVYLGSMFMKRGDKQDELQLLLSIIWALSYVVGVTFDILTIETYTLCFWTRAVIAVLATLIAIVKLSTVFQKKD